jgi:hypothetical protein
MRNPTVTMALLFWSPVHFWYVCAISVHRKLPLTKYQVEGSEKPMSFTQIFQLKKELANGAENWYVFNDIFRLVYPAA